MQLTNLCRFQLCHTQHNPDLESESSKTRSKTLNQERNKILAFIKNNFIQVTHDDITSIEESLARGQVMYIFGFDNSGRSHHIIAAVLYIQTENGSYINWIAVTDTNFDSIRFGKHANGNPFRDMGIGTFLLRMIQLQAAMQDSSISIYLQANLGSAAAIWYYHRGFKKIPNAIAKLPTPILHYYTDSSDKSKVTPYVHFITTEELRKDLAQRGLDPDSKEIKGQYMNLMQLTGPLKVNVSSADISPSNRDTSGSSTKLYCLPPKNQIGDFLKFPFNETAKRLNSAMAGLSFFDNILFNILDDNDELREIPNKDILQKFHYVAPKKSIML